MRRAGQTVLLQIALQVSLVSYYMHIHLFGILCQTRIASFLRARLPERGHLAGFAIRLIDDSRRLLARLGGAHPGMEGS